MIWRPTSNAIDAPSECPASHTLPLLPAPSFLGIVFLQTGSLALQKVSAFNKTGSDATAVLLVAPETVK
jgi:hypothetical protein